MISFRMVTRRPRPLSAALATDFVEIGPLLRDRRVREVLVETAPEGARPGARVRRALPEDLQRGLVERGRRLIRGRRLGNTLELLDGLQQPIGGVIHLIPSHRASLAPRARELTDRSRLRGNGVRDITPSSRWGAAGSSILSGTDATGSVAGHAPFP